MAHQHKQVESSPQTFALMSGLLSGYIVYDMTHYYTHHARPTFLRALSVALALLVLSTAGCGSESRKGAAKSGSSGAAKSTEPEETLGGLPISQFFIEHDRFASVVDPATVSAGNAYFVLPDDEVYGVVVDGRARAYPVRMISYYHVVNDTIADVPIAVTY